MSEAFNDYGLNPEQIKFCNLYAIGETRGHGVQCYATAYDIDLSDKGAYSVAAASATRLLKDVNILSYIRDLFEDKDLNDTVVDNELAFVIKQNADFGSKVAAIKEYNQLKARIVKKLELTAPEGIVIQGKKFANDNPAGL